MAVKARQGHRRFLEEDPQLQQVVELLGGAGLRFWLDAGTLLGLLREGRLLPHDRDLDIGLFEGQAEALEAVSQRAEALGYRVFRESYHDWTFKLVLTPPDGRVVDIQVYRRHGDHAWSPLRFVREFPYLRRPHLLVLGAMRWPWRMWWAHRARHVRITDWPWRRIASVRTWWVPLKLLEPLQDGPHGACLPADPEGYVAYRYGDWRRPAAKWVYWQDDGAARAVPPEALGP